jgi:BirA family biotin operon repressor/biotin-[acetyl-CoA-carboxylase] ligase
VLADAFERWSKIWMSLGFPAIADAWTARAHGLGEPASPAWAPKPWKGSPRDWTATALCGFVSPDGRVRRITAGDVFFGEAS